MYPYYYRQTVHMKILIVEDQEKLAEMVKRGLEKEGFAADYVTDGLEAEKRILMYWADYDLIILDLMLPGKNGFEICAAVRAAGISKPILVLTARDVTDEKISLLNSGADDYLTKPFSFEELLARIRSILRRPAEQTSDTLEINNIALDRKSHDVRVNGEPVELTHKEFMLLEYFMSHPDVVVGRNELHDKLWDFNDESFSNTIDVHMKNLRKKVDSAINPVFETIRGVGYKFRSQ
jgi:DNA-binding response OmpR family regulator